MDPDLRNSQIFNDLLFWDSDVHGSDSTLRILVAQILPVARDFYIDSV